MEKAHLKDTKRVISAKKITHPSSASYYLSPGGFFFSPNRNHSPVSHNVASLSLQTRLVVNKQEFQLEKTKLFHASKLSSQTGSFSDTAEQKD